MMYTPGAQLPGRWTFAYALIPHAGGWEHAWQEAHRFARPLRAVRVSGGTGSLPGEKSLVSIDHPQIVPSSIKLAEDEDSLQLVRVHNIADEPTSRAYLRAGAVPDGGGGRLNEENPRPAIVQGGGVRVALRQNEIETLRFSP
jgi:alpha-mannosidase